MSFYEGVINPDEFVTVTEMNHVVEVQHMEKMNNQANIRKIDENRYVDIETGEIKDFERSDTRADSLNSLGQTFKKLRYLINNNFVGAKNELHVTLTYAENMTNTDKLYEDVKKMMMRLRYHYKGVSTIDYINVVEPQGRGAWHVHALVRFNDINRVYIENSKLANMWEKGFVKIKSLKDVDNIGAYLSAYLTDLELTEDNMLEATEKGSEIAEKNTEGHTKKFVKGGRLSMYPPGMNIYRKSKGCTFPERQVMRYRDVKKIVGSANPHYKSVKNVDMDSFTNTITYLQYNTKR